MCENPYSKMQRRESIRPDPMVAQRLFSLCSDGVRFRRAIVGMFMANRVRLSKFLALVLRHQAEEFNLTLDEQGFADTDAVWVLVNQRYPGQYSYADLLAVVAGDQDGKKRYEIQGHKIRALFGHSAVRPISYPPTAPPELLYHGTTNPALSSIRREGLRAQKRQYVHLAINTFRAQKVAERHPGQIVILTIRSGDAHRAGIVFYHPEPEHFLAEAIPADYIDFPE